MEREFGVRYHPGQVWKLLIGLGWGPQRPTGRVRERNEAPGAGGPRSRGFRDPGFHGDIKLGIFL